MSAPRSAHLADLATMNRHTKISVNISDFGYWSNFIRAVTFLMVINTLITFHNKATINYVVCTVCSVKYNIELA